MRVRAASGTIDRLQAVCTIPRDWPEQTVRLLTTEKPVAGKLKTRHLGSTAEQMLLTLPRLTDGSQFDFTRTYEVTRLQQHLDVTAASRLVPVAAAKAAPFLLPSDGIESTHPEIQQLAQRTAGSETDLLRRATLLFETTQRSIRYVEGPFAGALGGLRAGQGDCEDRSTLFIALCRAAGIPARLVWGPGHAWSEFAMAEPDGSLVWIPADPTKERAPGVVRHQYPILQKGDRFRLPEQPNTLHRYLSPRCTGLGAAPQLESIEELSPIDESVELSVDGSQLSEKKGPLN